MSVTFRPSAEDISVATDTEARVKALRVWVGKTNSYHPSELPDHIRPPSNALLSHMERVQFITQPLAYGASYTAYLSSDGARLTTWTGDTLAEVIFIKSRKPARRGYMSDVAGSLRAVGIDGRAYYARHNGPGMYCRMRLCKVQLPNVPHVERGHAVPTSFAIPATCGVCGRTWDDSVSTQWTPAPSGRCPFEYAHRKSR